MSTTILTRYGISITKQSNGYVKIRAESDNINFFFSMMTRSKRSLQRLISNVDLALNDKYNSIEYDDREWYREVGDLIYVGIINSDKTFEMFLEDKWYETKETFPLKDIHEIAEIVLSAL
ncbi:hypothetical protein [Polluticaenibacter yanchengensis]|uniref:Uncharacterized protein n=1 Tax=Polluticaenibacter yanchengensis TaxID=3014562 RepID=A0ABT4UPU6_9BACT|nr:hypothetical protein [Chitinophagaceae bacterium LY-5]